VAKVSNLWKRLTIAGAIIVCTSKLAFALPPPDEIPPTRPGNLVATPVSGSQINLSWTASTDNRGVTGYWVYRCQGSCVRISTTVATTTSYASTGLASGVTYRYEVLAVDAAGNQSERAIASATTFDVVAPSVPGGLTAAAASGSQINLTWAGSTDNMGVSGYVIDMCAGAGCGSFTQFVTTGSTSYSVTGLAAATWYSFRVRAYDAASNSSGYSSIASAMTVDTTPPSAPGSLAASVSSGTQINLSWPAASDNVGVSGYLIERCQGSGCANFSQIASTGATSHSVTGLTPATSYSFRVRAYDAGSNYGGYSPTASAVTLDTLAPSTPGTLTATTVSGAQINLNWSASIDNVAVTGYAVERCEGLGCSNFAYIGSAATTGFSSTGLTAATTYSFRVRAHDAVPNYSAYSFVASARTNDTVAPTTPGSLTATAASANQIDLNWTASADNVAVTGYSIERCQGATCSDFAQLATTTATTYADAGLTGGTTYRYRVRASDSVPNYSAYSSVASATTTATNLDTEPPTVPSGFTVTAGPNQLLLAWTAATDNVGVFAYSIERCSGAGCTSSEIASVSATSYTDTAVALATSYSYRVRARDEAGNYSGYSSVRSGLPAACD
jgi:chitodextrinase